MNMFDKFFKKESPILGLLGLAGGIARGSAAGFESSGGTRIVVGNDVIHAFTSPGTLEFNELYTSTKIILVAGGGSGAYHRSDGAGAGHYATGGGGAGGVYVETGTTFTPGSYPISIGSGGANQTSDPVSSPNGAGSNGNPSTALGRQAYGGGGGGAAPETGNPGGSGGGCGSTGSPGAGGLGDRLPGVRPPNPSPSPIPAPLQPQGYPGGNGYDAGPAVERFAGGGGGAGQAGVPGEPGGTRGNGGYGKGVDWLPTDYGTPGPSAPLRYFGGGGGAAPQYPPVGAGSGGYGGGGAGNNDPGDSNSATPGTANTGGGGGAKSNRSDGAGKGSNGSGGPGFFAIRFTDVG